ncbi:hypothetical protein GCM10029976_025430 [Kribbella albertanoniae]
MRVLNPQYECSTSETAGGGGGWGPAVGAGGWGGRRTDERVVVGWARLIRGEARGGGAGLADLYPFVRTRRGRRGGAGRWVWAGGVQKDC